MSFPCTGCAACCRHIDRAKDIIDENPELAFPYSWDKTGKCEMLNDDGKCKVYDKRPLICNVDEFIKFYGISEKKFYAINIKACHTLMKEEGIYKKYRIKK
jgi:Fe-S-cluster containining protein